MNNITRLISTLALAAGTSVAWLSPNDAPAPAATQPAAAAAAPSLEALLNELRLPFSTNQGAYMVNWVDQGRGSSFVFSVDEMWKLNDGTPVNLVGASVMLFQMPDGMQVTPAMLKRINELNSRLNLGNVIAYTSAQNGKTVLLYNSSFWLNDATPATLLNHIWFAHDVVKALKEELMPFVNA